MKPSSRLIRRVAAVLVALNVLTEMASAQAPVPWAKYASSSTADRTGTTEFYAIGEYLSQETAVFDGPYGGDVQVDMDDTGLGGFGIGYHFSRFFSIRGDFMFGGATLTAATQRSDGSPLDVERDVFMTTGRLNVDYNILPGRFTPFLTAGIGYQYMEMELENASSDYVCWWDPWWGYVCYEDQPTASSFDFCWNAGAGVRWNITDQLLMKAMVGANWVDYGGGSGITTQVEGTFSIGWAF